MSTFMDGPAVQASLMLRRAPFFLRVVQDLDTGKFDALDQLDDEPTDSEDIYVYSLARPSFNAHLCRAPRGGGGYYEVGIYRYVADAPVVDLRETQAWRAWATAQPVPWE